MNAKPYNAFLELSTLEELEATKDFYAELLTGTDLVLENIDAKIEASEGYDKGKLLIEKCELKSQRSAHEAYLTQKIDSIKHARQVQEEVTVECNRDFDSVLGKAKTQKSNTDLMSVLGVAEPRMEEILADQKEKNNLYLQILTYLK